MTRAGKIDGVVVGNDQTTVWALTTYDDEDEEDVYLDDAFKTIKSSADKKRLRASLRKYAKVVKS